MRYYIMRLFLILILSIGVAGAQSSETLALRAGELVSRAADILPDFEADSHEWSDRISVNFKDAKAVLIIPALYKGGLFLGGETGKGVLLTRTPTGHWSYPIFYDVYSGSLGFQFGFEQSRHLLLVMTSKGLDSLFHDRADFGAEVNVAAGSAGGSGEVSTTRNLGVDILSYSLSIGAYAGLSLESSHIRLDKSLIDAYYGGSEIDAREVLTGGQYKNSQADRLRELVASYGD